MRWNGCGREGGDGVEEVSTSSRKKMDYPDNIEMSKIRLPLRCHADRFDRTHPYEEPAYEVYKLEHF